MIKEIPLFPRLEIETQSTCNRFCVTCLRNSIPDKDATAPWFVKNQLHFDDIKRVIEQSIQIGFRGEICLSHYNEPLMDERIIEIAQYVKQFNFKRLFMCSNADYLNENLASQLDGLFDDIGFAFYMNDPLKSKRIDWVKSLFKSTKLSISGGEHMVTHYSPLVETSSLIKRHQTLPCNKPLQRLIINHRGEMLLCCDDMIGNFDLGNIHTSTIEELWYSDVHQKFVKELGKSGGRSIHQHCLTCPRGA